MHAADEVPGPVASLEEILCREPGLRQLGFEGGITWDVTQPDGTPRKILDSSRIRMMGWEPEIQLLDGIAMTYRWFQGEP